MNMYVGVTVFFKYRARVAVMNASAEYAATFESTHCTHRTTDTFSTCIVELTQHGKAEMAQEFEYGSEWKDFRRE